MSLTDLKRDEAKKQLLNGEDRSTVRKLDKVAASVAAENTFGAIAAEYLARLEAREAAAATMSKNRWMLETLAGPALANRLIAQITPVEILAVLQQVERSGRRETARRMRAAIGSVFRFAIAMPSNLGHQGVPYTPARELQFAYGKWVSDKVEQGYQPFFMSFMFHSLAFSLKAKKLIKCMLISNGYIPGSSRVLPADRIPLRSAISCP